MAKNWKNGLQGRLDYIEDALADLADGSVDVQALAASSLVVEDDDASAGDVEATIADVVFKKGGTIEGALTGDVTGNVTGDVAGNLSGHLSDPQNVTPVNAVAAQGTLIYQNATDATAGKTVTIGAAADERIYKFVAGPVADVGDVLIGANADATFTNLSRAINNSGGVPDTDYKVTAAHPTVAASINAGADTITLAAITKGVAGNAIPIATDETTITLNGATLGAGAAQDGVDGTPGAKGDIRWDTSYIYVCSAANTIAGSNWLRLGNTLAGF